MGPLDAAAPNVAILFWYGVISSYLFRTSNPWTWVVGSMFPKNSSFCPYFMYDWWMPSMVWG